MTKTQENILKEINYYNEQKESLGIFGYCFGYEYQQKVHYLQFKTSSEQKIFDDFKAKLIEHYTAQIDGLIKKLAC